MDIQQLLTRNIIFTLCLFLIQCFFLVATHHNSLICKTFKETLCISRVLPTSRCISLLYVQDVLNQFIQYTYCIKMDRTLWTHSTTGCPKTFNPFYLVSSYMNWFKTSWTYSNVFGVSDVWLSIYIFLERHSYKKNGLIQFL